MVSIRIPIPIDEVEAFCRTHLVSRLSLFGSVLGDDFSEDSDVDVLVEFLPGHTPGLAFFAMQEELSRILKYPVDLHTPNFLSRYFREEVLAQAENLYVAA